MFSRGMYINIYMYKGPRDVRVVREFLSVKYVRILSYKLVRTCKRAQGVFACA